MNWQPPEPPQSPRERELQAELDSIREGRAAPSPPTAPEVNPPAPGPGVVPDNPAASSGVSPATTPDAPPERPPFYCPACGRALMVEIECVGRSAEAPHPPVQSVSSDELDGDPEKHTPAPVAPGTE